MRSVAGLAFGAVLLAACGGAGIPAALASPSTAPATAAPVASPSAASPAATSIAGGITFTVANGTKAIVRVTEQLADRKDLSDAVLTSAKVSGDFTLLPDGAFAPSSKIVVDMSALASDSNLRDNTVKRFVLETSKFPQATFVPSRADGLVLPLAESGDLAFRLTGQMTVHGVTKDVTFDVKAKRAGADLSATANVTPALQFATFGMTQPRVPTVISIKDEIRLEVQLVARQGS